MSGQSASAATAVNPLCSISHFRDFGTTATGSFAADPAATARAGRHGAGTLGASTAAGLTELPGDEYGSDVRMPLLPGGWNAADSA
ncbi:PPW family C-terminal domain-containing PPE protein [Mycolicibacterium insubricum]|uniref:PPW family C-terminal domain-containing PPE protein n=1 Tax=Mycolicibacterium insubricum TaxID=444597 RepID=UPI0039089CA8